jgi:hypothetical protein
MIKPTPDNQLDSVQLPAQNNVVSIYTYKRALDPVDAQFDFSLWAQVVRERMLAVIEKKG